MFLKIELYQQIYKNKREKKEDKKKPERKKKCSDLYLCLPLTGVRLKQSTHVSDEAVSKVSSVPPSSTTRK